MSMGLIPHHLICDHTQLWEFSKMHNEFLEQLLKWPFELNSSGGVPSPISISFENFDMMQVEA